MSSDVHSSGDNEQGSLENIPAEWYDAFSHPRRVRLLAILGASRTQLSVTELTTAIVENEPFDGSTAHARRDVQTSLRHNHLPRLADHGIITWDGETGVELVAELPVARTTLTSLLELCERENCGRLLEALVHPTRLRLCTMVTDHDRPLSVETLASRLVSHDAASPSDPERATLSLYHTHLPLLADAGLLEFDPEAGVVTGHAPVPSLVQ
ncbi:DUF7344 domain-containing protein [Natronorubrum sulfidifaciens]|uniref:DUF7344 domain-containing protein n=1 Tax=Natronorubrum sulfidifaciens JCM 14089 TaxID=1230460 RepID=L9W5E0_9EURY|nr:hypothetical protein [Natronorubrum sulfidifaciens]ELY44685.1 hypothetical protein C495_09894 [Natronorubrum sulfidifaciens JCM 14089]